MDDRDTKRAFTIVNKNLKTMYGSIYFIKIGVLINTVVLGAILYKVW